MSIRADEPQEEGERVREGTAQHHSKQLTTHSDKGERGPTHEEQTSPA